MFLNELKRSLPQDWFENLGADIYSQYVKLRVKLLGGQVFRSGPDGKQIEYLKVERGNRPKLVFLPGFSDTKENFFDPAQILVKDFDLLVPDLPGFGKSFKDPHAYYNMENYGRWICELIQEVGWTDFHLVGNSLGGATAFYVALMMPKRVKTLTVVDPAGIVLPEFSNSLYHEFVDGRNIFSIHTHEQFKYFLQRVFFKPPLIPPFVWEHIYLEFAKNADWNHKVLNDLLEGVTDMADPRMLEVALNRRLQEIKIPTLVVWGDEDSLFPAEMGQFVKEQMPHARLYIMPDVGHSPQVEAPLAFCRLLTKFIRETERQVQLQEAYAFAYS
jgi:pimeloyl-ACP methyl ester carboxylesterase